MEYNPFTLENKTILITGASSGIGRATAIECSKLGAKVIITARNAERLSETFVLLEGGGHEQIIADLSKSDDLTNLIESVPALDGLVNNAGFTDTVPVQFITEDKLNDVLQVNTIAPILIFTQLLKKKKLQKNSSAVFVSSIGGPFVSTKGNGCYAASKGAISGFVKTAAIEAAPKNIRVNAVCPGMIDTHILDVGIITEEQLGDDKKNYPLQRYGKPEDVAWGTIYLLSDASSFVTGSSLVIDGGFMVR